MLKAVIVDDETLSRQSLEKLIQDYCPEVEVVASVGEILSAVKEINIHQPDLVFLDIELPNYSGFELIKAFDEINFDIVFTTGYEHYAVKAFKVSAAGYLLKPIDVEELSEVVSRIKERRKARRELTNDANGTHLLGKPLRIVLPAQDGLIYLNLDEVIYLQAEGRYTHIHLLDRSHSITTKNLRDCLSIIGLPSFLRIHRSFIINLIHLKRYARGRDSFVLMENDIRIDVGKNYKEDLSKIVSFFIK
jgi:Response regulator of the LytR/AlgR family